MIRKNQSGFTLIELIVTSAIAGLMIIGIVSLYISIEESQRRSYHLEVATRAGERQIESLRNLQYGNLEPDTTMDFTSDLPDVLREPRSATVYITEPTSGIRKVDVTITYNDGNKEKTVKQSSLIGIVGIAQ